MKHRASVALTLAALLTLAAALPAEATWSRKQRLGGSLDSTGIALAVSGETVHAVWWGLAGFGSCSEAAGFHLCYSRSTDCGETWSEPVLLAKNLGFGPLGLAASGKGVHLAWTDETGERLEVLYSGSRDAGKSWSAPQQLSRAGRWAAVRGIDAMGEEVYVSFVLGAKGPKHSLRRPRVVVAVSLDGGNTWESKNATPRLRGLRTPLVALGPGLGAGGSRLHLVWSLDQKQILYQLSDDRGGRWTEPLRLDPGDSGAVLEPQALATVGAGAHALWDEAGGWVFYNGSVGGVFRSEALILGEPGERGASDSFNGVLAGARGVLHAAWQEIQALGVTFEVFTVRSNDRGETWSRPKRLARKSGTSLLAIAASDARAGSCKGSSHLIYGRPSRNFFEHDIVYRRRPRTLE